MTIGKIFFSFVLAFFFCYKCDAQYNFETYFIKAKNDIQSGNYADAINKLNICIQVEPSSKEAYFFRALCKYSLFDDIGAEQDFTAALSDYSPVFYDAHHNRSLVRYRTGNFSGAINDITMVIDKQPNNPKLYVERAFSLLANNDFNSALSDCKKAIKLNYIGVDVYLCKAVTEDALADYENALCDYDIAIKIDPVKTDLYVRRGITKFKMERYVESMADYNYAIKIDSAFTFAYFNRAETEIKLGNNNTALKDYNTVLLYEPRNAYAYFNRAVLFSNMKKYKEGISDFDKVLAINPDNIQAIFNRAKLKQNISDFSGAMSDYDKVISLYPYFTEAYYNRSRLKLQLNDQDGANKDLETGKVMSDVLHLKSNAQLSRDSLLLTNLVKLNAEFNNSSSAEEDTIQFGLQSIFYITEKNESSSSKTFYNATLASLNRKLKKELIFTNEQIVTEFLPVKNDLKSANDSSDLNIIGSEELLLTAINKTNALLLNDARDFYDGILERDNKNAIAYFSRAGNTFREIEMISNNDIPIILNNSSNVLSQNQKNEKCQAALADLNKTIQLTPSFQYAYYNRAIVKCLLQDYYGALIDYETAVKINPDFSQAYFNKGFLLFYLKSKDQACLDFSKAGELGIIESYTIMKKYCFR